MALTPTSQDAPSLDSTTQSPPPPKRHRLLRDLEDDLLELSPTSTLQHAPSPGSTIQPPAKRRRLLRVGPLDYADEPDLPSDSDFEMSRLQQLKSRTTVKLTMITTRSTSCISVRELPIHHPMALFKAPTTNTSVVSATRSTYAFRHWRLICWSTPQPAPNQPYLSLPTPQL